MFCPPGYLNWPDIRILADEWAERFYVANALSLYGKETDPAFSTEFRSYRDIQALERLPDAANKLRFPDRHFDIQLISFWAVNAVCSSFDPLLCSREGNLLRANDTIFLHPDQFYYFALDFPLRSMPELSRIFEEYDARRMGAGDLWDRYSCLDPVTGEVKEKVQTRNNFASYWGEESAFDLFVAPFLGCSVVLKPESIPETFEELIAEFAFPSEWAPSNNLEVDRPKPKKRGQKYLPARSEIFRRYPDGIPDSLSSEAIAEELSAAGFPVTSRSILNYDKKRKDPK
jgi:hypothetical protein